MNASLNNGSGAPLPRTGRAMPQHDDETELRCAQALEAYKAFFLKYERQEAIVSRINILRLSCLGKRDVPLDGRRLSEVSQAGKSRMLRAYRDRMNAMPGPDGQPNPYRVLYVELKGAHTLKMLCRVLLRMLGDPHPEVGNAEDVQERVRRFIRTRGVELLIVDEVQHLNGHSNNKMDITDELKLFLDAGIVPVVFAGNEKSRAFFLRNDQLSARLGPALELSPLSATQAHERTLFKTFCRDLDDALVKHGIMRNRSGLDGAAALKGLLAASGGHVGRVCRIVEAAVEHAVMRQADFVELYDLSHAVDTFAIPQRYIKRNPFAS
ncbi:MAG: ATP-binding protein [Sphingomonas sp.]|nr:ATP-binding protein [Sphingomonas sp.]